LETIWKFHCLNQKEETDGADAASLIAKQWECQWIESAKRGDVESFERIVLAYQQKVFNLAFRLLGDREEAEDLAQEVFINVFRHLPRFRGDAQFSTWIYQITLNHSRNRLKYLKRRHQHATDSLDDPILTSEGEIEKDLPYEGDVPEDVLHRLQVQELVQSALDELREDYREVLVFRDIQELSYQEIAEILGLPEGTVKSRLHRARWELKDVIKRLGIKGSE
jgi:RNA polymerase sigma-70 factor (ECF subfamily)